MRHQTETTGRARSKHFDGFQFAESGGVLQGVLPVAGFPRLRDMLSSSEGEIKYEVLGIPDESGRLALRVRLSGQLMMTCQRCLGMLEYPLQIDEVLVLARSESEIEAQPVDPESPDRIVAGREMEVGELLEDEILLAVPFAPHHEQCSREGSDWKGERQDSPFADLRGLLHRSGRTRN